MKLALFLLMAVSTFAQRPADFRTRVRSLFVVSYTYSMFPAIQGGETVRIDPRPFSEVRAIGEDVVFWPAWSTHPIMHRTAGREGGRIVTQGINCRYPDPGYLTADNYLGHPVVIAPRPNGPLPKTPGLSLFALNKIP